MISPRYTIIGEPHEVRPGVFVPRLSITVAGVMRHSAIDDPREYSTAEEAADAAHDSAARLVAYFSAMNN